MKKTDIAYIAGIIDGEGYIGIKKNGSPYGYRCLRVSVTNTNQWIVTWLQFSFGGSLSRHTSKIHLNAKPYWQWVLSTNKAVEFLKLILPYLRIKRTQAELAIQFQGNKPRRGENKTASYNNEKRRAVEEAQGILMGKYHTE